MAIFKKFLCFIFILISLFSCIYAMEKENEVNRSLELIVKKNQIFVDEEKNIISIFTIDKENFRYEKKIELNLLKFVKKYNIDFKSDCFVLKEINGKIYVFAVLEDSWKSCFYEFIWDCICNNNEFRRYERYEQKEVSVFMFDIEVLKPRSLDEYVIECKKKIDFGIPINKYFLRARTSKH